MEEPRVYQVMAKLLDGKTRILNFPTPTIPISSLKTLIQTLTSIPTHHHLLLLNNKHLHPHDTLHLSPRHPPTVTLLVRLRGGKGGFGSLLRGAATKAGQKKTNNFDACRDMSGRRLRHVNAEKKMEEWRAEEKERGLEKAAEEYIKEKCKVAKKDGGSKVERYLEKYKEDSNKCRGAVEKSVRESLKRKGGKIHSDGSKKVRVWKGKRKVDESDSDSEEENEKSVVLNDVSTESVGCSQDKMILVNEQLGSSDVDGPSEPTGDIHTVSSSLEVEVVSEGDEISEKIESGSVEEMVSEPVSASSEGVFVGGDGEGDGGSGLESGVREDPVVVSNDVAEVEKPINFDEFNSAKEMEVLGMERLKSELQGRGLKCGGTLQERASRLFLLKTTPVEMLPKKLLAKK